MTVPFVKNSEFLEAITLLVDLQFAICEDDADRADALRDALDIPLNKLSWEANEWLRGLSGDLDMLCDQEVFEPNELSAIDYQRSLMAAWQNIENDPAAVLPFASQETASLTTRRHSIFPRTRLSFAQPSYDWGAISASCSGT